MVSCTPAWYGLPDTGCLIQSTCPRPVSLPSSLLQIVEELASNVGVIERLQSFQYKDAKGKDWGLNVRQRAKELCSLVTDPDRIRQERSKVGSCCNRHHGDLLSKRMQAAHRCAPEAVVLSKRHCSRGCTRRRARRMIQEFSQR